MVDDSAKLADGNNPVIDREIDGVTYSVTRLGWWDVQTSINLLNEVLGEPLADALKSERGLDEDIILSIGRALPGAIARATSKAGRRLQVLWGQQTSVEAKTAGGQMRSVMLTDAMMDTWFSQHPSHVLPWLRLSLEVQVLDFFEPVRGLLGMLLSFVQREQVRKAAEEPSSPST